MTNARNQMALSLRERAIAELNGQPYGVNYGGVGNSSGNPSGKSYSEMSPAEFNQAAQNRANASFVERNLPGAFAPMGLGWAGKSLDNSMFSGEQSKRSADFIGKGQSMPDEDMAYGGGVGNSTGGYSGGGVSAADLGGAMAEGNTTGSFAEGGVVTAADLGGFDPPGPDDGFAALDVGEVVLTPEQQRRIGLEKIAKALMGDPASAARMGEMDPMSVVRAGEY